MLNELQKIVLVTGSAQRIGKYLIERLANDGFSIALHYNNSEKEAYEIAKELLPITNIMLFKADLTKHTQAANLIEQVNKQLGPINLLINNASIYKNDNLLNLKNSNLEDNLNIHLNSPLYLAKGLAKQEINANIINILDSDISRNVKSFFSYSLSKKSLSTLTTMLAVSLAPHIRVNGIAPGPTLFKEGQNIEVFNEHVQESLLKEVTNIEEIYNAVKFIINNQSITGQIIYLDGGKHLI